MTLGWSNLMWWQTSECAEDVARANWNAAFTSLSELHFFWLGWSQIAESTDTWLWQSGPRLVAYPIVSVATKELSESVLLAVSIAPKGILLLSEWRCIRILYYSPSLATWHPVQCSPNMRVADCATVWVCKSLQLIYLSVLHLTLDIYIRIYTKTVSVKQAVLVLWLSTRGLNFCGPSHLQERAWQVMGFGSFWGQTGWPCSNQAKCKNCSEAVEIGTW